MMEGNGGSYSKLPRAWEGEQEVFSQIFAFQREPLSYLRRQFWVVEGLHLKSNWEKGFTNQAF